MSEFSFPFPSVNGDRKYNALQLSQLLGMVLSDGVFPAAGILQVTASEGMQIALSAGSAVVNHRGYYNDSVLFFTLDAADGMLNRIDRIVLRYDATNRKVAARVVKGTPASTPSAPALVRDTDYHDVSLATVFLPAGATSVLQGHITDTRMDPEVCGIMSSLITPDTAGWYDAWQAEFLYWMQSEREAFSEWLSTIQGLLDDDVATQLAAAIAQNTADIAENALQQFTGTLLATGWANNTQTITVSGVTANTKGTIGLPNTATAAQREAARNAMLAPTAYSANSVTIVADGEAPEINIPIMILGVV